MKFHNNLLKAVLIEQSQKCSHFCDKGIQTETLVSHKRSPQTGRLPIIELMYRFVSNLLQTSTLTELYHSSYEDLH